MKAAHLEISTPSTATSSRLVAVDLVRTFAIVAVLAVHIDATMHLHAGKLEGLWTLIMNNGFYGVPIFFVVSGYVITRTTMARNENRTPINVRDFYQRRFERLFPLFILIVLLGACTIPFVANCNSPSLSRCFYLSSTGWMFWTSLFTFSFNWLRIFYDQTGLGWGLHWAVLWSLAVEEQFYLFFPLLLNWLGTGKKLHALLLLLIAMAPVARYCGCFIGNGSWLVSLTNTFAAVDLLALGVALFFVSDALYRKFETHPFLETSVAIFGLSLAAYCYAYVSPWGAPLCRAFGPTFLGIGIFLFLIGSLRSKILQKLPAIFVIPGFLSYEIYLLHATIICVFYVILKDMNALAAYAVLTVVCSLISLAAYSCYEKPAKRLLRRYFENSSSTTAKQNLGVQNACSKLMLPEDFSSVEKQMSPPY